MSTYKRTQLRTLLGPLVSQLVHLDEPDFAAGDPYREMTKAYLNAAVLLCRIDRTPEYDPAHQMLLAAYDGEHAILRTFEAYHNLMRAA